MKNRLPLPIAAIKEIQAKISENRNNLWVKNPLKNALNNILDYEYAEGIKTLTFLQSDFPSLLDYKRIISLIQKAEKKYNAI